MKSKKQTTTTVKAKNVYISAPITGYDLNERKAYFAKAAANLRKMGYTPVNPLENGLPLSAPYAEHMRVDISMLLKCDGYVQSSISIGSSGCQLEENIADMCGIPLLGLVWSDGTVKTLRN